MPFYCSKCGARIDQQAETCPQCGHCVSPAPIHSDHHLPGKDTEKRNQEKPRNALKTVYITLTVLTVVLFAICILSFFGDLMGVFRGEKTMTELLHEVWKSLI